MPKRLVRRVFAGLTPRGWPGMAFLIAVGLATPVAGDAAPSPPVTQVTLAPALVTERGVGAVDVTLVLPGVGIAAGAPLLKMPLQSATVATVAETLQDLRAQDAAGPLLLIATDTGEGAEAIRHWRTGRAATGAIIVRYRAPVDNARGKGGPPIDLRAEGGGVSGAGRTFILRPDGAAETLIALRWDLSAMAPGATAVSTYGRGDVRLPSGSADRLAEMFVAAGPLHVYPTAPSAFTAVWLGDPPFDPQPLMAYAEKLHGFMARLFHDPPRTPFLLLLRYNPLNDGGGTELGKSFVLTWGAHARTADSLKLPLAHEMTHTWTAAIASWFAEGIAIRDQSLLPLRAGLISPQTFLDDLNATAMRYYTNPLNRTPDAEINARFWTDTRIRVLPYDRGALYMAVLDGRIRRASGGRRSVDDLVGEIARRMQTGEPVTEALWVEMLRKELGPAGPALHAQMLSGEIMLPEPGDFGPCFTRTVARFRRFDVGFDMASLIGAVKIVRGLEPGSEAERAGVRNGDVITWSGAMDALQSDVAATLTLNVSREGRTFPITYLPRGELADAYQWVRVASVPDQACRP